jgi:5-formyltetrahydrofolate cyclo-ligase
MESNLIDLKQNLRKRISELKKSIPFEQKMLKSDQIFNGIEKQSWFIKSDCLMAYWAMKDEVQTRNFILKWHGKKKILLPVVKNDVLDLRLFEGEEKMKIGKSFGILEPQGPPFVNYNAIDLIIVPGVAFDPENNRLGRGKAYYDKLLPMTSNAFKAGVCFDFQFVQKVPADSTDVKMDIVVYA